MYTINRCWILFKQGAIEALSEDRDDAVLLRGTYPLTCSVGIELFCTIRITLDRHVY
jgi:hypothetical protein